MNIMNSSQLDNFYVIVEKIITYVNSNKKISKYLNDCKYNRYNQTETILDKKEMPLVVCLGGSSFKMYRNIFSNYINHDAIDANPYMNLETTDYDISFSLKCCDNSTFKIVSADIETTIKNYFYNIIKDYAFAGIDVKLFNFERSSKNSFSKLHLQITYKGKHNHVAEFVFWTNNKLSDSFDIAKFDKFNLVHHVNNNMQYFLLPLDLLMESTHHAIADYFEARNFAKCKKYILRSKYIKKIYGLYSDLQLKNKFMEDIFSPYLKHIRRKYIMMNDYPYFLALFNDVLDDHGIFNCIYKEYQDMHSVKNMKIFIDDKLDECKKKEDKRKVGDRNLYSDDTPTI